MSKFLLKSFLICAVIGTLGYFWHWVFFLFILIVPLIILGIKDLNQTKHSLKHNFPIVGRMRWWAEWLRPKVYQYFK